MNKSFESGVFPTPFKIAIIKPLFKKKEKDNMTNYRSISLITNYAKIYKKLLKIRITNFLNKYNIISDDQFGFREGRGGLRNML